MPASSIIHAACFAVGAAVGGGAVAALHASRKKEALRTTAQASNALAEVGVTGDPRLSAGAATAVGPVLKYGNPGPVFDQLARTAYVVGYDRRLRHPAWTAEHLTLASLGKSLIDEPTTGNVAKGDREKSTFQEDESLPVAFRAKLQDYFRSGYDRGHMVPAADAKRLQEAMDETFLLSNIARKSVSVSIAIVRFFYWAYLEDWCRRLTRSFSDVYVFTIPLYLPHKDKDGKSRVHGRHHLQPSCPGGLYRSICAPNAVISDETPLESFVYPIDAVERAAGLTLFSDAIKGGSKHICKTTKCEVIVRRFDDAQKRPEMRQQFRPPRKRGRVVKRRASRESKDDVKSQNRGRCGVRKRSQRNAAATLKMRMLTHLEALKEELDDSSNGRRIENHLGSCLALENILLKGKESFLTDKADLKKAGVRRRLLVFEPAKNEAGSRMILDAILLALSGDCTAEVCKLTKETLTYYESASYRLSRDVLEKSDLPLREIVQLVCEWAHHD
ncbi:hypothetical protein BJV77DRAFT_960078 [Russula vinacea]|nr:hypothetical protein BJV77DRAFT_960078 [Russula vinacea]